MTIWNAEQNPSLLIILALCFVIKIHWWPKCDYAHLLPKDFKTYLVKVMNRELMEIEGPPSLTTIPSLIKENAKHLCLEEIKNRIKKAFEKLDSFSYGISNLDYNLCGNLMAQDLYAMWRLDQLLSL